MTIDEAIQYFEALNRRFTELWAESDSYFGKMHYKTSLDAINQALEALKEKVGEQI